jgi:hypothetical protein
MFPTKAIAAFEERYFYEKISDNSRGRLCPMYERVFNHYHNRKSLDAPFTWQAVERLREGRTDREGRTEGDGRTERDGRSDARIEQTEMTEGDAMTDGIAVVAGTRLVPRSKF